MESGVHVLDPTLLLTAKEWLSMASKKVPKTRYVFVYNLNRNPLVKEIAKRVAKENGLQVINFADSFDFIPGAKNRLFNTAHDFISHIANAEYVVTDSFHGTAFSLNFNRQFVCVKAPRYNTRLESILRTVRLERLAGSVEEGVEMLKNSINYDEVNALINEARAKSIAFLQTALA